MFTLVIKFVRVISHSSPTALFNLTEYRAAPTIHFVGIVEMSCLRYVIWPPHYRVYHVSTYYVHYAMQSCHLLLSQSFIRLTPP